MYTNKKNGKLIKTKEQNEILENEFQKNSNWDLKKRKYLSKELGLSAYQIYKWLWDKKEQLLKQQKPENQKKSIPFLI